MEGAVLDSRETDVLRQWGVKEMESFNQEHRKHCFVPNRRANSFSQFGRILK